MSRYQSIVDSPESNEIDYDSVEASATKPTNGAIRVNDLLETITGIAPPTVFCCQRSTIWITSYGFSTDRYRPLPSFSKKLRFLIDIQIAIFDLFHARLASSLEAYLTFTSTLTASLARAGSRAAESSQPDLHGLPGVERLTKVYGSAEYLEKKMRDWSDDVFFLDLWEELQDRARAHAGRGNLAGSMSVEHVADKTSSAVGNEDAGGALFDETAGAYRRLRIRAEGIMTDQFVQNVRGTLKVYGRVNAWSVLSEGETEDQDSNLTISAELDSTMQLLQSYLVFLESALAQAPLRRITRQVTLSVQTYLWDHVLMRYTFSLAGSRQFERDVQGIWEIVDRYVGAGQGEMGMRRLAEGLVLLRIPSGSREEGNGDTEGEGKLLRLGDVEESLFRSNESGREILEELGLEVLSESEARSVVERRVDLDG